MMGLNFKHLKNLGGIDAVAERNARKAKLIHDVIETSDGFYRLVYTALLAVLVQTT